MTIGTVIDRLPQLQPAVAAGRGRACSELYEAGAHIDDEVVHRHRRAVTPDSVATIIYTSGTTGRPKGCVHHPRQLHVRGGHRDRPLGAGVPLQAGRRGGDPAVPAARARLRADGARSPRSAAG